MRTVFKYPLKINDDPQDLLLPKNADINLVAAQRGQLCLWIQLDTEAPTVTRRFLVHGTGHALPLNHEWVGSVVMEPFVWHVYEENPQR